MVVSVYGALYSPFVQSVVLTLKEANVPYKIIPVNFKNGENKTPEYLSKQPFGQIPCLVDKDGFVIYESRAIARYIISKYAPDSGLIPKDLKEKALFEQAASIETSNFSPFILDVIKELLKPTSKGIPVDEERLAGFTKAFNDKLKGYEAILSKQKYIAGDQITLADFFHLPLGSIAVDIAGFKGLDDYPNVKRWWGEIYSRPLWKGVWAEASVQFAEMIKK